MPPLIGNGEGHTLLILTDEESRLLREYLDGAPGRTCSDRHRAGAFAAYNAGIARGTAKRAEEFKAEQAARRAKEK